MISFAEQGSDVPPGPVLRTGPAWRTLRQHWIQGATLAPTTGGPLAALDCDERAEHLVFRGRLTPNVLDRKSPGETEFVSGLWRRNVVEWFIGNPQNGRYLEVHLAPSAQWWACVFRAVREREQPEGWPLPLSHVRHRRDKAGTWWEGEVRVPAKVVCDLLKAPGLKGLRSNLCAIWFPPGGNQCFFSFADLPGTKPDFHQPAAWLPLVAAESGR